MARNEGLRYFQNTRYLIVGVRINFSTLRRGAKNANPGLARLNFPSRPIPPGWGPGSNTFPRESDSMLSPAELPDNENNHYFGKARENANHLTNKQSPWVEGAAKKL